MNNANTYINYEIDLLATGNNIRNFMKIAGYTARDMEAFLACTQMTFFNWQEGKNLPSFDNLLRLAGILKVPIEKIVVFRKRDDGILLKKSNSGFIRNNVFFTYNNATQVVVRDCIAFNKKFGIFPDKILLSKNTFEAWITNQEKKADTQSLLNKNVDLEIAFDDVFDYSQLAKNLYAELVRSKDGGQLLKTDSFTLSFEWHEEIPKHYYRIINSKNCSV